jgi:eukaryotic-like serine/threonine-protein kinase
VTLAATLCLIDLHRHKRALTGEWSNLSGLAWAPGGKEIWFSAAKTGFHNALYAVTPGGKERLLWRDAGWLDLLDISEDKRVLVNHNEVRTAVIGSGPGDQAEHDLSWFDGGFTRGISNDGHLLLLEESGQGGGENGSIFLRPMNGDPPLHLGTGFPLAISPDGKWLLAYRRDTTPPRPFLVPTGVGEPNWFDIRGIEFEERGAWFPDSHRVLLCGHKGSAQNRTYILDTSTGKLEAVTPEGVWGYFLSPDGLLILMRQPEAAVFNLQTGATRAAHGLSAQMNPLGWTDEPDTIWISEGDLPSQVSRLNLVSGAKRV